MIAKLYLAFFAGLLLGLALRRTLPRRWTDAEFVRRAVELDYRTMCQ